MVNESKNFWTSAISHKFKTVKLPEPPKWTRTFVIHASWPSNRGTWPADQWFVLGQSCIGTEVFYSSKVPEVAQIQAVFHWRQHEYWCLVLKLTRMCKPKLHEVETKFVDTMDSPRKRVWIIKIDVFNRRKVRRWYQARQACWMRITYFSRAASR